MPPKGSTRAPAITEAPSASESEAKQLQNSTNSRSSTKARNAAAQAAQAAQAELLAKHIHSNGPGDQIIGDPLDFETLPDNSLRAYKDFYGPSVIPTKKSLTQEGYLLGSEVGKRTYSYKAADRVTKAELAKEVKKHFLSQYVKESDTITNFLYKVNNQDKAFKLNFKEPPQ